MSNGGSGTTTQRAYRIITVSITPGSTPTVDPWEAVVDQDRKDEVLWNCPGGQNFVVCFGTDTPFNDYHFYPGHNESGPPTRGAKGKTYKYSVEVAGGRVDPNVIVK